MRPLIQKIGANLRQLESMIDGELQRLAQSLAAAAAKSACSSAALKVLEAAQDAAQKMKDRSSRPSIC